MFYGLLVTTHLFCATAFIGIVFFEVLILEGIRPYLPAQYMGLVEEGIHRRGRKIMPWFVGLLFLSGITMAGYAHSAAIINAIQHPFSQAFGTLLSLKIILALSVLTHFIIAMRKSICGNMSSKRFKYTHLSVFFHMILIVILAKAMFYVRW
jgi:uncharacterized protein